MEKQLCQSCGLDMLETKEAYGTNADGSLSEDYCHYCYVNGSFTADLSMSEMIIHWVTYLMKENPALSEADARRQMEALIPKLKRWCA